MARPTHWSIRAQVRRIVKDGKLASMAGLEGGHQINGSLATLRMYYRLGCRYLTLTHNGGPGWADAALDENSKWNEHAKAGGLSRFGVEVVKEMNRLGMAVDLSHVHPDTMKKAIAVSEAPVLFSHSNTRAVCNHPRNVPDDVLRSLSEKDGVVMINVNAPFVAGDFFVKDGAVGACVEMNRASGARQFSTKSFLGDDAVVLARSSCEEPASPRHQAAVTSMA